ncbi:hypothetical protein [Hydrogenophaga sp. BPS33]|uniref:hypothetical protein n=1 Tax=Hydrogenophaga sp. BPS33 TaxID=2651974 RepID=UPI00131FD7E1|nr:hypothetical protein [Hydrogenophaga sp. BPS33]QHE84720.1 hypothetical protein F9K07_07380 [Hydrogenophaga sp. BPS33]
MISPALNSVEGRSFPRSTQVLATVAVVALLASAWKARSALAAMTLPSEVLLLAGLAAVVVVWGYLNILFSTTRISNDAISQGWLWRTSVQLRDIAQVKLLRFKPLDFLVAPRLVVRAGALGNTTFHMADPAVLAMVDLLVHGQAELVDA